MSETRSDSRRFSEGASNNLSLRETKEKDKDQCGKFIMYQNKYITSGQADWSSLALIRMLVSQEYDP